MKERYNRVMTEVVKTYVESGQAVASRTISQSLDVGLSPASIRNVMCDLERMGMLDSGLPLSRKTSVVSHCPLPCVK